MNFLFLILTSLLPNIVLANSQSSEEKDIRKKVESLLSRHCQDYCELVDVEVTSSKTSESVLPGFSAEETSGETTIDQVKVEVLVDQNFDSTSKSQIESILSLYLGKIAEDVDIVINEVSFPKHQISENLITTAQKNFEEKIVQSSNSVLKRFCPDRCILGKTTVTLSAKVNGSFVIVGDKKIGFVDANTEVFFDETLSSEEKEGIVKLLKSPSDIPFLNVKQDTLVVPNGENFAKKNSDSGSIERNQESTLSKESKLNQSQSNFSESENSKLLSQSEKERLKEALTDSKSETSINSENQTTSNQSESTLNRIERIERLESEGPVQIALEEFQTQARLFALILVFVLVFIFFALLLMVFRSKDRTSRKEVVGASQEELPKKTIDERNAEAIHLRRNIEIEDLKTNLFDLFCENPRVSKALFTRILTEQGIEETAKYVAIFGDTVMREVLRDPSLQSNVTSLLEYYNETPIELSDEEKHKLLKKLHQKATASKMIELGKRTSSWFEFLTPMNATQVYRIINGENKTVQAVVLTQLDFQKREQIFRLYPEAERIEVLKELARTDQLPKEYIQNVGRSLQRKRVDHPELDTETIAGSEVLLNFMEKTDFDTQKMILDTLSSENPENFHVIKQKLVTIETLQYLKDSQLLELVLGLTHSDLLTFLMKAPKSIVAIIFSKAPEDLVLELKEELETFDIPTEDAYQKIERKLVNRMRVMANEGLINLADTNDRMFDRSNKPYLSNEEDSTRLISA